MVQRKAQKAKPKASKPVAKAANKQPNKPPVVNGHGEDHKDKAGPSKSTTDVQVAEPDSTKEIIITEPQTSDPQQEPSTSGQHNKQAGGEAFAVTEAESTTKDVVESKVGAKKPPRNMKKKQDKQIELQMTEETASVAQVKTKPKDVVESKVGAKKPPRNVKKGDKLIELQMTEETATVAQVETKPKAIQSKPNTETNPARSRRKRAADVESTAPSTSAKPTSSRTKAKRLKIELDIPPLQTVSGGKVFVIGENDVGQLGFGEEVEVKRRPVMLELPFSISDVVAGGMHSVCLTENGEVITFGCNDEGALGRITSEEGSECIPRKVELPERIVQVSAGDSHTAALAESGQVFVWGNFRSGDGHMGLTPDEVKQVKPIRILDKVKIVKIASGSDHLVCLSKEGIIYTCGCGETGQLGRVGERFSRDGGRKGKGVLLEPSLVPQTKNRLAADNIWTGAYSTFFKTQNSSIYAFGLNNYHHLGFESENNENSCFFPKEVTSFNGKTWNEINGGQHHTLALDNEGQVYSFGRCEYGRLGLGEDCGEKSHPTVIPTLEEQTCTKISCGNCVSFALNNEGSVYSWGFGTNHQLGHGNDEDCNVPSRIEGNFFNSWKAHKVSGGGQHTLILATPKETSTKNDKK